MTFPVSEGLIFLLFLSFSVIVCRIDDTGRVVAKGEVRPFAPARGKARNNFESESESLLSAAQFSFSAGFLMYFPLLILASAGFGSSSGIAHLLPIFTAPGMRSSLHNICMRRDEIPHLSAVCGTERYFMVAAFPVCPLGLFA